MKIKDFIKHKDKSYNLEKNNLKLNKKTLDYLIENNITEVSTSQRIDTFFETLDEYTYSSSPNEMLLYKGILIKSPKIDKTDHMSITTTSFNKENIEKIYQHLDFDPLERIKISVNKREDYTFYFNKDHVSIVVKDNSLEKICKICKELSESYKIDNLEIDFNITNEKELIEEVNYYNYDYTYLDELSKNTKIKVNYRALSGGYADYADYRKLISVINDYRKIINNKHLSPLEKLMAAYDLMKRYKYNKGDNILDTYTPDKIIKYGNITCVGYSVMMEEILKCLDDNIKITSLILGTKHNSKEEGHERNLVRIDDDKYNIHGLYFLDATWDSYNEKFKEKYGEDYQVLDVYRHFLVPFCEYDKVFPKDSKPPVFSDYINLKLNDNWDEDNLNKVLNELKDDEIEIIQKYKIKMFSDIKKSKDKFKYVCAKRIPFSSFLNAVVAARQIEGYDSKDLKSEVLRASKTNSEFYEDTDYDIDEIINKGKIM